MVNLASSVSRVLKGQWVHQAPRASRVQQEAVVNQAFLESLLRLEHLDHRALKVCKEKEEKRDHREPQGLQDFKDHQATLDN